MVKRIFSIFLFMLFIVFNGWAQNNVGIGTTTPHGSAMLQISDGERGILIPQTDTALVQSYVSSLTPAATIADGLLIYETNVQTYMYYNEATGLWVKMIDMIGPRGPTGPQGAIGPTGITGGTNVVRDSSILAVLPTDKCGDYFIEPVTGKIWMLLCDGPVTVWVDTLFDGKPIATLRPPDEDVHAITLSSNSDQFVSMTAGGPRPRDKISMQLISGLNEVISVERHQIAYVHVLSFGTVSSFGTSNLYKYAQYDIEIDENVPPTPFTRTFFFNHTQTTSGTSSGNQVAPNVVTIRQDGPPDGGGSQLIDKTGWSVTATYELRGPFPPGEPDPQFNYEISTVGGNRFSLPGNGPLTIASTANPPTENVAYMCLLVVFRSHPDAPDEVR